MVTAGYREVKLTTTEAFPDVGIPAGEMNEKIVVLAPEATNNFQTTESIDLAIEVISDDQILFGYDYGARMFIFEKGEWVEVPNFVNYPDGKVLLTNSQNDPFKRGYTFVSPIFSDSSKPVTLRIIVIGNIYRDEQITDEVAEALNQFMSEDRTIPLALLHGGSEALNKLYDWKRDNGVLK